MKRIVVGVTGASGMLYAKRLIEALTKIDSIEVYLIISETAKNIAHLEEIDLSGYSVHYEENCNLSAEIASGSFLFDAMIIIPCSMKSLAAIANGHSSTLISRTADVALKERRKLIIVPRETPYSRVHLINMLSAHDAGVVIMPASPPMYTHPKTIVDLADQIVSRVLDHCDISHTIGTRWKE
ncbi:MAG TPA: UbiX family flavin prenyltransferase [Methanocorpusculum sp.]|nr:UbiX family flavin prenyltransferase [Methanocorpusculum sp.]